MKGTFLPFEAWDKPSMTFRMQKKYWKKDFEHLLQRNNDCLKRQLYLSKFEGYTIGSCIGVSQISVHEYNF